MIEKSFELVENTATPLALLAIGAGFTFTSVKQKRFPALWGTAVKLLILPVITLPFAMLCGFHNQEMLAILIMIGGPATVSGYIMAKEMNNDAELSSCIIVFSTLLSAFTLTFFIFLLKSLGFLR